MLEKSMGKSALMVALVTGNVIWGGYTVHAEEPNQIFTLDPMVVTATRTEKRDVDVPASTTILTSEDLKATGAQNLQVALGRVPGLIYKTFAPGGGAMGTMANEIAIRGVSNGTLIMLNGSPMNLRGKYFLDAIPIDSIEKVEIVKGGGSVLYGSEAMGGVINIITKQGGALQQNREYVTKQNLMQVTYQDDSVKGNLYYNQNKLMADGYTNYTTSGAYSGKMYDTDEKNRTYGADIQKKWEFGNKTNLILGSSYQNEFYDDYGKDGHKSPNQVTSRNIYAVYGQYDYKFDEKNEFIFGARETWTTGGYKDQNYDNFSMSGQYLHKLTENDSLYASVGQSFIMPTFSQMYGASDSAVSNPDLKPQKGTNYELGWKRVSNNHSWKAAIYHIDITDNITATWDGTKTEYKYTNEDFKNTGVEITCDIIGKDGFTYNWGINYGDPKVKGSKKPYWDRKYGRWQMNGGINYTKDKWITSLQGTYLAQRVGTPSSDHSVSEKPYFLTSLTTTYNADKQSSISLTLDNLLNREDNLSHSGSEYYSTPFNFLLSYNYKF